jgi:hypothetical protein
VTRVWTKDMVALVSDGVSNPGIELLEADGWRVERIDLLKNPNSKRPARFLGSLYQAQNLQHDWLQESCVLGCRYYIVLRKHRGFFLLVKEFCANLKHFKETEFRCNGCRAISFTLWGHWCRK